ncbi:hypothetical protein B0H21DRAFT_542809 [Amylocystis lapponica]|nr:hypothetical protein B0H21DRAFT_542809 [Amylocystis lapponica]
MCSLRLALASVADHIRIVVATDVQPMLAIVDNDEHGFLGIDIQRDTPHLHVENYTFSNLASIMLLLFLSKPNIQRHAAHCLEAHCRKQRADSSVRMDHRGSGCDVHQSHHSHISERDGRVADCGWSWRRNQVPRQFLLTERSLTVLPATNKYSQTSWQ